MTKMIKNLKASGFDKPMSIRNTSVHTSIEYTPELDIDKVQFLRKKKDIEKQGRIRQSMKDLSEIVEVKCFIGDALHIVVTYFL